MRIVLDGIENQLKLFRILNFKKPINIVEANKDNFSDFIIMKKLVINVYKKYPKYSKKTYALLKDISTEKDYEDLISKDPVFLDSMRRLIKYWYKQNYISESKIIKFLCNIKRSGFDFVFLEEDILKNYKPVLSKYFSDIMNSLLLEDNIYFSEGRNNSKREMVPYYKLSKLSDMLDYFYNGYADDIFNLFRETWITDEFILNNRIIIKNFLNLSSTENKYLFKKLSEISPHDYSIGKVIEKNNFKDLTIYKINKEDFILSHLTKTKESEQNGFDFSEELVNKYFSIFESEIKLLEGNNKIKINYEIKETDKIYEIKIDYRLANILDEYMLNTIRNKAEKVDLNIYFREYILNLNLKEKDTFDERRKKI